MLCWIITDGKAGDENQCLGVAEALGVVPVIKRVKPRLRYSWMMPWQVLSWSPVDPNDLAQLAPPFPDLVIGSGRRAVAYVRWIKHAAQGRCFTVFLKDPRTGAQTADFIWVQEHDRLRGPNVLATLTAPHRVTQAALDAARANPDPRLLLRKPRVAVLVGGNSHHYSYKQDDQERLLSQLRMLSNEASLMISPSRRTANTYFYYQERNIPLKQKLLDLAAETGNFCWDGDGDNPYIPILALADYVIVTADSTNMIGEAAATGKPVLIFHPTGGHDKITFLLEKLGKIGVVHSFEGRLTGNPYSAIDSTPLIAGAIRAALSEHHP